VSTSLAEINVVPLVDVMLVLLVIFMVTAPMMQQGFSVHLPQSRKATAISAPVTVSIPLTFRKDGKVRVGNDAVALNFLTERVRQVLADRLDKSVIVAADGQVTTSELMQITDRLHEAGVDKVGLQTQPAASEAR
jgi:biopolymer transport protein TolR